jgi:hypothetical protein
MQKKLALFKIGSQEYQLSEVDIPGAKCLAEYDDLSEIYPTFYTTSDTYDVSNFASNSAVSAFYATTPTRTVSEAAKRSIGLKNSIHQKGEGNSQFGTRWIHNPKLKQSKKIRSTDDLPPGWIEGRKIKFDED